MTVAAIEVLDQIARPGRTLALCDETDFTQCPTTTMVANIHAWVALVTPSDHYAALAAAVLAYQAEHSLPELHGNEIVTPGSASTWNAIAPDVRLAAYEFACGLITAHAAEVRYVHISEAQYATMVARHQNALLPKTYKRAVKAVFKTSIVAHLSAYAPALVVFDKEKNNAGPTLEQIAGATHLVGGGVLRAGSHTVPGLQLADIAAYAVGRYLRRRDGILAGTGNAFDMVGMTLIGDLQSRFMSLL